MLLKKYRRIPYELKKSQIRNSLRPLFVHKTGFASINIALERNCQNKSKLLLSVPLRDG